ncbi:hypothetical protein MNBD_GAMMA11-2114 [hydrothermal vent metagenome]|uniref:carbonic anhydrase n=1 Tax=hydrothermal vent metagenome TaxID=652676 RepID=A0A3B0XTB7_9ZZZZ
MKIKNNIITKLLPPLALAFAAGPGFTGLANATTPFAYSGDNGPSYWGGTCNADTSQRQSPIDIVNPVIDTQLTPLNLNIADTSIDLLNNGHTIEQVYEGTGSSLFFNGVEYDLEQFHFHTFSEHVVAASRGDMELHGVFTDPVSGDHVVVSMMYDIGSTSNSLLQDLINAGLPPKEGDTSTANTIINLGANLTNTGAYYTYDGSLTTPGCTENVTWVVLKDRAILTQQQRTAFRGIMGNNFRPLQDVNGRTIRSTSAETEGEAQAEAPGQ